MKSLAGVRKLPCEKQTPARLQPLPPHIVEQARASGWSLVPAFWMERRLADLAELRRQLEDARAEASQETRRMSRRSRHPVWPTEDTLRDVG